MTTTKIRTVSTDIILLFTHQWRQATRREDLERAVERRVSPYTPFHYFLLSLY